MDAVTSIFSPKVPKQDTAALDAQKKQVAEQEAKAKAESDRLRGEANAKLGVARKQRLARGSLLTGLETGVSGDKKTVIG